MADDEPNLDELEGMFAATQQKKPKKQKLMDFGDEVIQEKQIAIEAQEGETVLFSTTKVNILATLLKFVGDIKQEVEFKITDDGLSMIFSDGGNVIFHSIKFHKEMFQHLNIPKQSFVTDAKLLASILKAKTNNSLQVIEKSDRIMAIIGGKIKKRIILPMIELDDSAAPPNFDKIEQGYDYQIELETSYFDELINQIIDVVGTDGAVKINNKNNALVFTSRTDGEMPIQYITEIPYEKELNVGMGLNFLKSALTFAKISQKIQIKMKTDYPLCISTKDALFDYKVYIAPRVDNE
jgi:DNA polymerase III sliding clamp (beta) subunit (PCNA family)